MWTYQQARHWDKRQDWWIWTAVIQETDGRSWSDFEVGDRSENTFQKLYARLPEAELYRSDAYPVYASWLPPNNHVIGKGGAVNWNEGLHSWLRSKLNRLVRDTKGYTKSVAMLVYSLALLVADWTAKPIPVYVENTWPLPCLTAPSRKVTMAMICSPSAGSGPSISLGGCFA